MSRMRLPLTVSVAFHAAVLAALVLLANRLPATLTLPAHKGFEIALNPPAARLESVPPVAAAPQPVQPVTPVPERPVASHDIANAPQPRVPLAATAELPPPPPMKPVVKPRPRTIPQRREVARPTQPAPQLAQRPPSIPAPAAPTAPANYQPTPAARPAPAPNPELAAGYRAALSRWFEDHKRYPESARQRDEQGSAVVRFRVAPDGRVLGFALLRSTGYPDLDNGIAEMLRGARLPAFPPGLQLSYLDVAVTLRFALEQ